MKEKADAAQVTVVTVTYKSGATIQACIESVLRQAPVDIRMVIIENSQDESLHIWQAQYPGRVEVIVNRENAGFGRACNQGLRRAGGEFVYFLNPDCVLGIDVLARLLEYMHTHAQVGLCGSRLVDESGRENARPEPRYPGQKFAPQAFAGLPGSIAWVLGASLFARREILETVGGFDEDYELYAEDIDLCLRIRQSGHALGFCPEATVQHVGGHSAASLGVEQRWLRKQKGLNLFLRKHYPPETSAHIIRRDSWRARWRLALLQVRMKCGLLDPHDDRICKYKAVRDAARLDRIQSSG